MARGIKRASRDGKHLAFIELHYTSMLYTVVSSGPGTEFDDAWFDALPPANDPRYVGVCAHSRSYAGLRGLLAERLEQAGRKTDALRIAQAELSDPFVANVPYQVCLSLFRAFSDVLYRPCSY